MADEADYLPDGITFERVPDKDGTEQFMLLVVVSNATKTPTGHFLNRIGPMPADQARKKLKDMLGNAEDAALDRIFEGAHARFAARQPGPR